MRLHRELKRKLLSPTCMGDSNLIRASSGVTAMTIGDNIYVAGENVLISLKTVLSNLADKADFKANLLAFCGIENS